MDHYKHPVSLDDIRGKNGGNKQKQSMSIGSRYTKETKDGNNPYALIENALMVAKNKLNAM